MNTVNTEVQKGVESQGDELNHVNYHKKYQDVIVNGELIRVPSFKQIGKRRK